MCFQLRFDKYEAALKAAGLLSESGKLRPKSLKHPAGSATNDVKSEVDTDSSDFHSPPPTSRHSVVPVRQQEIKTEDTENSSSPAGSSFTSDGCASKLLSPLMQRFTSPQRLQTVDAGAVKSSPSAAHESVTGTSADDIKESPSAVSVSASSKCSPAAKSKLSRKKQRNDVTAFATKTHVRSVRKATSGRLHRRSRSPMTSAHGRIMAMSSSESSSQSSDGKILESAFNASMCFFICIVQVTSCTINLRLYMYITGKYTIYFSYGDCQLKKHMVTFNEM